MCLADDLCSTCRQTSSISRTTFQNWNASRCVLQLSLPSPLKPGGCWFANEDVVGAAPTGAEWSTFYCLLKCCLYQRFDNSYYNMWGHLSPLTLWGRVTHICVSNLPIIGSDHDLPPNRRQDIIWTNAGILLIGPLGTNFSEILMHSKVSSGKRRPSCLGFNVIIVH